MGIFERLSNIFKAKANKVVDGLEDPREILDYSFEKQGELINRLRRDIVSVVTAKKAAGNTKGKACG